MQTQPKYFVGRVILFSGPSTTKTEKYQQVVFQDVRRCTLCSREIFPWVDWVPNRLWNLKEKRKEGWIPVAGE